MPVFLAWAPWLVGVSTVLFLVICVMLVMTVLIQRPQGGGLAGAFGSGAGSGQTAFGAKTGDALTIFTIIVFVLFIGSAIVLNYAHHPDAAAPTVVPTKGDAPPESDTGTGASTESAKSESAKSGSAPLTAEPSSAPKPAPEDAPTTEPAPPTAPPAGPK